MSPEPNIDPQTIRNARRTQGFTQSELATAVGASQSAISMFEAGHPSALSEEKIRQAAEILGVDLAQPVTPSASSPREWTYCPEHACPSVIPFCVGSMVRFAVTPVKSRVGEKTRCRWCGELLERSCPNPDCGAAVKAGAFCEHCGTPYVGVELPDGIAAAAYVARRWQETMRLRGLLTNCETDKRESGAVGDETAAPGGMDA